MSKLNQQSNQILDWEEIVQDDFDVRKLRKIETDNEAEKLEYQKTKQRVKKKEEPKEEKYSLSKDPLMKDAREKLNYYLNRIPSFKNTKVQLELLQKEMNNYKRIGDTQNYQATFEIIKTLQGKVSDIREVFSPRENAKARIKREEDMVKFKNSPKLKELETKLKEARAEKDISPIKLVRKLNSLRAILKDNSMINGDVIDMDSIYDDKDPNQIVYQEYHDLLKQISDITELEIEEIAVMNAAEITRELQDKIDLGVVNDKVKKLTMEIQYEKDVISGALSLSNIVNNVYDIRDEKGAKNVKEIMASKYIGMVKAIAYRTVSSYNAPQYLEDCISAGLLELTRVINAWISDQKEMGSYMTFGAVAYKSIGSVIKRELYTQMSGGRLSGSSYATLIHYEEKKVKEYISRHPELRDFDSNVIKDLIVNTEDFEFKSESVLKDKTESEIRAAGENEDDGDLWTNVTVDRNTVDMLEAQSEYESLLSGINKLMKNLNKFERKLFVLTYGFEKKIVEDGKSLNYTQEEIGKILYDFYKDNGGVMKNTGTSFSQPAIYEKKKNLEKKLVNILDTFPELKASFDYLREYFLANNDLLNTLSDSRDEIGIKRERESIYNEVENIEDEKVKQSYKRIKLVDGSTIEDEYELSDYNPFEDNEVVGQFYGLVGDDYSDEDEYDDNY